MTLAQVGGYLKAIQRQQAHDTARLALAMRAANQEGKDFDKWFKAMTAA